MGGSGVTVSGWKRRGERNWSKTFLFPDFKTALSFVNRVGPAAEILHLAWGQVDVEIAADAGVAQNIDRIFFRG